MLKPPRESVYQAVLLDVLTRRQDIRLWRQNVGSVKVGDRLFRAGPPAGAADLSGLVVGHGWRLEIEVKTTSARTKAQRLWADFILSSGGVYVHANWNKHFSMAGNVDRIQLLLNDAIDERRKKNE